MLAADDRHADGPARTLPSPTRTRRRRGSPADAGLFTYPVLQAADILAYDTDIVPVGDDQVQHIEVCRDLAGSFNHQFGNVFVLPKAYVLDTSAHVPGTDGEKMSKSYNNTLEMFEDAKAQRKKIMRIVTDSRPMDQPKEPAGDVLYDLFSLVAPDADREAMAATLPPRRLRLRRSEKGAGRRRRKILGRTPRPPRRTGRQPETHPRNPRRRRRQGPQESGRSAQAEPKMPAASAAGSRIVQWAHPTQPRPPRRRPRFGLRALFVVVTLTACAAAWLGTQVRRCRHENEAIAHLSKTEDGRGVTLLFANPFTTPKDSPGGPGMPAGALREDRPGSRMCSASTSFAPPYCLAARHPATHSLGIVTNPTGCFSNTNSKRA